MYSSKTVGVVGHRKHRGGRQRAVHSPALYSGITIGSIKAGVECEKEMGENKSPTP